jgi:hypothetical protein
VLKGRCVAVFAQLWNTRTYVSVPVGPMRLSFFPAWAFLATSACHGRPIPPKNEDVSTKRASVPSSSPTHAPEGPLGHSKAIRERCPAVPVEARAEPLALTLHAPTFAELDYPSTEQELDDVQRAQLTAHANHPVVPASLVERFPFIRADGREVVVLENVPMGPQSNLYEQRISFLSTVDGSVSATYTVARLAMDESPGQGPEESRRAAQVAANGRLGAQRWVQLPSSERTSCESASGDALSALPEGRVKRLHTEHLTVELETHDSAPPTLLLHGERGNARPVRIPIKFRPLTKNVCNNEVAPDPILARGLSGVFGSKQRGFLFVKPIVTLEGDCAQLSPETHWTFVKFPDELR